MGKKKTKAFAAKVADKRSNEELHGEIQDILEGKLQDGTMSEQDYKDMNEFADRFEGLCIELSQRPSVPVVLPGHRVWLGGKPYQVSDEVFKKLHPDESDEKAMQEFGDLNLSKLVVGYAPKRGK